MTYKVALTGGIASGKTAVSDMFAELGVTVIDADVIAREVVAKGSQALQAITEYFGTQVLTEIGELDRQKLRSMVFSDEQQRQWLNNLLHPLIRTEIKQRQELAHSAYSISVIPLLFESGQYRNYDRVLTVDCPTAIQLKRLMERDQSTLEQAQAILDKQATREQRLSIADDVIVNDSDLHSLKQSVIKLDNQYRQLARN
ncbi:dephospho-CoA kinase [Kangiella koreensis]|uniref:Dephospho-CoA kinase n=1 Tax=Kangiella koreensis (strain DSM 16069 / JCM 12317 / KCTC 12182 / SW-125) TaxID=523791 RepID=C7RA10_KANKD|nr:dephospho-CoA kinase [Kangiella koreensis]ACV26129.1 dephospho-CoA kinase [Kangiella koreensis DSM 16069]